MICAIVLAAGRSRRMGTQKLLLPFGGSTLIGHVVDQVVASAVGRTFVVVGADREAVAEALGGRSVTLVPNPHPDSEMLDSVRCGLRALPDGCEAVVVVLGDQPGLTAALIDELVATFREGSGIVVPACDGRRGHPILFAARYILEVLARHDDTGLRGLLRAHTDDVHEVEVEAPGVLADIDQPEDYRQALGRSA